MWIASVSQSWSSLIPRENWLCSATILSNLDTFSWKWQKSFSSCPCHFTAYRCTNCKANHRFQITATSIGSCVAQIRCKSVLIADVGSVFGITGSKAEQLQFTAPTLATTVFYDDCIFSESAKFLPNALHGRWIRVVSTFPTPHLAWLIPCTHVTYLVASSKRQYQVL